MLNDRDAIKVRLEATRDATSRSRVALLATTVAALCVLIAEFNAYFSWNRAFALDATFSAPESTTGIAQRKLLEDWVSSTSMNISPLGIHVNVSDATLLGGVALSFLTLWLFYCARRENRLVGTLLRDTRDADLSLMDLAYSGIVSYMVLTAIRPGKPMIDNLADTPRDDDKLQSIRVIPPNGKTPVRKSRPQGGEKRPYFPGVQLLFQLSPLAILLSLIFDTFSVYYFRAPFRAGHKMPALGVEDYEKFGFYLLTGVVCLFFTARNSWHVRNLDRATGSVLREYHLVLREKRRVAMKLRESRALPRTELLPCEECGIQSNLIVIPNNAAQVELRFDQKAQTHWQTVGTKIAEIREAYVGGFEVRPAAGRNPDMLILTSSTPSTNDVNEQIEYVIREAFRIKRVVHSHVLVGL